MLHAAFCSGALLVTKLLPKALCRCGFNFNHCLVGHKGTEAIQVYQKDQMPFGGPGDPKFCVQRLQSSRSFWIALSGPGWDFGGVLCRARTGLGNPCGSLPIQDRCPVKTPTQQFAVTFHTCPQPFPALCAERTFIPSWRSPPAG